MMRNLEAKHLDFADLVGLIPSHPKFLPSNLDMVYERRGHFLVCEWKRENEHFGGGQFILLKALAQNPKFHVLIVTGDTDAGMHIVQVDKLQPDGQLKRVGGCMVDFEHLIIRWFGYVEKQHKKVL